MNKFFHWILVILLLGALTGSSHAESSEQTMREVSIAFLNAVIGDVLQNPETAKYFPEVKLGDVVLSQTKLESATGWIYRWSYEHEVHYVLVSGMQRAQPVFENNHAIVFSIFVSYKNGSAMVSRIKSYAILEKSGLTASFDLKTGDENAPLQKIDEIIKSHLVAFQKAVAAP